jgi:hypothetical protein
LTRSTTLPVSWRVSTSGSMGMAVRRTCPWWATGMGSVVTPSQSSADVGFDRLRHGHEQHVERGCSSRRCPRPGTDTPSHPPPPPSCRTFLSPRSVRRRVRATTQRLQRLLKLPVHDLRRRLRIRADLPRQDDADRLRRPLFLGPVRCVRHEQLLVSNGVADSGRWHRVHCCMSRAGAWAGCSFPEAVEQEMVPLPHRLPHRLGRPRTVPHRTKTHILMVEAHLRVTQEPDD